VPAPAKQSVVIWNRKFQDHVSVAESLFSVAIDDSSAGITVVLSLADSKSQRA
jgi:hypothetical protein